MNLQRLQQAFLFYIHDDNPNHQNLMAMCVRPKSGSIVQRLNIYRNNYHVCLCNILKKRYPVSLVLVGEDFFVVMSRAFINETPSTCLSVDDYGTGESEVL